MATMKLTVMGLERELSYSNKSLFDLFNWFNDPHNNVDKDALKNRILMRCGEFEVVYSDPEFFRECVATWSTAYKRTFEKWLNVLYTEYAPLENYDMHETFQDDETRNREASGTSNTVIDADDSKSMSNTASGSNHSQTVIDNDQTSSASSTGEHKVSAFDSSTYSPESQDTRTDSASASADETSTTDGTTSTTGSANETGTHDETQNNTTSNTEDITAQNIHTGARHGNIGVTSSQQLLESEMGVALFSFYDKVADVFVNEFCVMVY